MMRLAMHPLLSMLLCGLVVAPLPAWADLNPEPPNFAERTVTEAKAAPPPPEMAQLQEQQDGTAAEKEAAVAAVGLKIRLDALREAAWSYGARGGLAARTFAIQRRIAELDGALSKAFDFRRLLLNAPSGLMIEPPVVTEAQKATIVDGGGQSAAVADRIIRINRVARIVTAPRDWHLYLERDWGQVEAPPAVLLPKDRAERDEWRVYVRQGWDAGVQQADETFQADLDRMTSDLVGMVRYRELLAQGMISATFAAHEDRGITGGGSEMRIGDRGVTITGQSVLIPRSEQWQSKLR
jgi:defect in organelle trafficking protein DotC